jgi:hypothetical protein
MPYPLKWGASTAKERGPVICSRLASSIKHLNAIGAHSGSYAIYRALSIAMSALSPTHKPDYSNSEPPVSIPPNPAWFDRTKIVSFDPWGHLVPTVFRDETQEGRDIRPSIAVTKAHLKMSELDDAARGVDGVVVLRSCPVLKCRWVDEYGGTWCGGECQQGGSRASVVFTWRGGEVWHVRFILFYSLLGI